jgi:hypothetical protein
LPRGRAETWHVPGEICVNDEFETWLEVQAETEKANGGVNTSFMGKENSTGLRNNQSHILGRLIWQRKSSWERRDWTVRKDIGPLWSPCLLTVHQDSREDDIGVLMMIKLSHF